MKYLAGAVLILLTGCGAENASEVTLYRNSPIDTSMRIHFASFDAEESLDYNYNNCQMAIRLLNANVAALARQNGREPSDVTGFWCEAGGFSESGENPISFASEYPTTTETGW